MVIVMTLAFAICWFPIHILELMRCANSTILLKIFQSHPKFLYGIRAVAHALAYLNSCLNPYLYALLNRNFCFDLLGVLPTCVGHWKESKLLHPPVTNILSTTNTHHEISIRKKVFDEEEDDEEDDEIDYEVFYQNRNSAGNVDVACQVNLLRT